MLSAAETRADELRLQALHDALADVLAREDWPAMADVDRDIAAYLQAAGPDTGSLRRKRLKALHDQARERCAAECERLRGRLRDYLARAEGHAAYRQSEAWQEPA